MIIRIEKIDIYKGVIVKALLNNSITGVFMDKRLAAKQEFKLQKLKKLLIVKRTYNSGEAITHQVKVNMYYKNHIERMRMNVCNLGKTNIILGIPWLAIHNPEIN